MIEVEANGKKTQEMHADGGLTAQTGLPTRIPLP